MSKNYGIKLGSRPTDYVGGSLPYEIRNLSGDWRPYTPVGEIQRGRDDWMDCTVRSATNSIEIQEKFLTGIEPNYNDREVAIGCGVTKGGAYLWQAAEYIRHTGLAQQATFPDTGGDWNEQYTPPSPQVRAKLNTEKADWLAKWDIKDEDVPYDKKSLKYHLKHAPLQIVIPGHAMVDILCENDIDTVMDSYPPYTKKVPGDYPGPIIFAKKIVLYKRCRAIPDYYLLVNIKYLDGGKQVEKLKSALNKLGWMPDMSKYQGYDYKLAELVLNFQKANLSHFSWAYYWARFYYKGRLVDEETRRVINNTLDKINNV